MSQLSKLRERLTPKSGGAVTAFVLAILLELLMHLGRFALLLLIIVFCIGVFALVSFIGAKIGAHFLMAGAAIPLWLQR